jgi:hypothetical protein
MEYNFNSSIRGYHVYKNVWKYEIGDKLICEREENNPNDKYSVKLALQRGNPGQCVGHVLNMDETPVWFEMPGKSTLAERGGKGGACGNNGP